MFISACQGGARHSSGSQAACFGGVLSGAIIVSLLNPLAWIESPLVVGSLATALKAEMLATFAFGAFAGSLMKFSLLGFGARTLAPLFAHSAFCQAFDTAAANVMAGMVALLLQGCPFNLATSVAEAWLRSGRSGSSESAFTRYRTRKHSM